MNKYAKVTTQIIKLATLSVVVLLSIRFWLNLTRVGQPELMKTVTSVLLSFLPGSVEGVDLASAGFDLQAPLGALFYIVIGAALVFAVKKLFRENFIQIVSGFIDLWTSAILGLLILGFVLVTFETLPGSSTITDLSLQLVKFANQGSFINQEHLTILFVSMAVLALNILTDYLLQIRFEDLYFEHSDNLNYQVDPVAKVNSKLNRSITEVLRSLDFVKALRHHSIELSIGKQDSPTIPVTSWEEWAAGYFKHKASLAQFVES